MAEQDEKISVEQFRMVPQELVDGDFSDAALRCFLVMQGLGPKGSTAKVMTIARRMKKKGAPPVRKAQAELLKAGFIRLRAKATRHEPNHWDIWPFKPEVLGGRNLDPLDDRPPAQSPPSDTNINKREEKNIEPLLPKWRAVAIFKKLWQDSHKGEEYLVTGKDHGNLKTLLQNNISPELFTAKVRGYLASQDPFIIGQKHSLSMCCSQFNKWSTLDKNSSAPNEMEGLA